MQVDVRPLGADEVKQLQRWLPPEHPEAHVRRLQDQRMGRVTYLVAWADGRSVGHLLVRWGGPTNPELLWRLGDRADHPYVEALLVHPAYRSRSIGTQLLAEAERLVRTNGYASVGLAVAVDNVRAWALYDRLGYRDADLGEFTNHWSYIDEAGHEVADTETCWYLIKPLAGAYGTPREATSGAPRGGRHDRNGAR
jgi:ribosomal protein S18 acetylase RimI-like enzyme